MVRVHHARATLPLQHCLWRLDVHSVRHADESQRTHSLLLLLGQAQSQLPHCRCCTDQRSTCTAGGRWYGWCIVDGVGGGRGCGLHRAVCCAYAQGSLAGRRRGCADLAVSAYHRTPCGERSFSCCAGAGHFVRRSERPRAVERCAEALGRHRLQVYLDGDECRGRASQEGRDCRAEGRGQCPSSCGAKKT